MKNLTNVLIATSLRCVLHALSGGHVAHKTINIWYLVDRVFFKNAY